MTESEQQLLKAAKRATVLLADLLKLCSIRPEQSRAVTDLLLAVRAFERERKLTSVK